MEKSKIKFTECELIVDNNKIPELSIFYNIQSDTYELDDTTYIVNCEIIKENLFWIYIKYGKLKPYSKDVYNIETQQLEENPKKFNQIEPKHQLFAIYCYNENILYTSDWRKNNFLELYFKFKFNKDFFIKKYFTSPKDFVDKITSISSIKFTSGDRQLFNADIFNEVFDVCGYGMPIVFSLETKYKEKMASKDILLTLLENFKNKKENSEISKMICIGKDENGIETKFNLDTYLKIKSFEINKDDDGMYDENEVKALLLENLNV